MVRFFMMAGEVFISQNVSKKQTYEELLPQLVSLLQGESDVIANMANLAAALKQIFGFLWVGFYIVRDTELILGPFQGPVACTRIAYGKGVCGTAWKANNTYVVPDVNSFPGHIACSTSSKSEIVLPLVKDDKVVAVLDIDSESYATFDNIDAFYLGRIVRLIDF